MEFTIPPDLSKEISFEVKKEHSASHLGSGSLMVLSTPSMILFMERTARIALDEILPKVLSSVGIEVNIQHRKAVKIGNTVKSKASIKHIDGKKIIFEVLVTFDDELVGTGTHTRYIIDQDKFLNRI